MPGDTVNQMRWCVIAVVAGCGFQVAGAPPADGNGDAPDAPPSIDAPDAPPGSVCVGAGNFQICVPDPPATDLALTAGTVNTGNDPRCNTIAIAGMWTAAGQPVVCMLVAHDITVAAQTTAQFRGAVPLVLVATGTITIDGTLDVSSHSLAMTGGPGNQPADCGSFSASTGQQSGGAGGTFMTSGGHGGVHDVPGGGPSPVQSIPTVLRGGCRGQNGDGNGGNGGGGGGGLYLVAGTAIVMGSQGIINASGGGGQINASNTQKGNGGGGSGGMIMLDAPVITTQATSILMANGAGGAGGGDNGVAGIEGGEPVSPTAPAPGGVFGLGGPGGNGFAEGSPATNGGDGGGTKGGGGGGGGAGYIHASQSLAPALLSPAPT